PFGGQQDIAARLLRHVSPAFSEDPLRVLRVARFAARFAPLGFQVAPATMTLMRELSRSGELEALTPERVWQEIDGALRARAPQVFVEVLRDAAALLRLLPEIHALFSVPWDEAEPSGLSVGQYTLKVMEQTAALSQEPMLRFAALTQEIGHSAKSKDQDYGKQGAVLIENLAQRLRVPNEYRDLAMLVSRYRQRAHQALGHDANALYTTLEHTDALRRPQRFEQFLLVCEADWRVRGDQPYPQRERLQQALAIARGVDAQAALRAAMQEHGQAPRDPGAVIRAARIKALKDFPRQ
ncbi:MAG: multifunctional CCA tRNA nucleotidyl transferase/2'3'-cyclic phosphodiesterase/2'nucleotidase/phosphatase, partial [Pseudomonadales bacterium]|nr:multifunctional CCA tRNA nucleotidyl transferase/2'3'-cyclic phosphodiesterase/2'nucleotidase/phosphatase [Pseudomonadales bacterium]